MEHDVYCREIEAYLCRRNDGHLVRVVGPAFEMVAGWAARGIPLKVAQQGIDRSVERRAAKGARRRPLRIEFCEADVLDAFDQWRRAVGVGTAGGGGASPEAVSAERARPGCSLREHLDRVAARLTALIADGRVPSGLESAVAAVLGLVDQVREASRTRRGEERRELIAALVEWDADLVRAARDAASAEEVASFRHEAERELEPFRAHMPAEAYQRARDAAVARRLRERWRLPEIVYTQG